MPGVVQVFDKGPVSYRVDESVPGGRFVAPSTDGHIALAADDSVVSLGLAVSDAEPESTQNTGPGETVTAAIIRPDVAVAQRGVYRIEVGAGGLSPGALVKVGSNTDTSRTGLAVAYDPADTGATPTQIVGRFVQTTSVAEGARGMIHLMV